MFRSLGSTPTMVSAFLLLASGWSLGQTLEARPLEGSEQTEAKPEIEAPVPARVTMPMSVPAGTPIKVVLNGEILVRKIGQPIFGTTVEPIFVFDKLLIPAGTTVNGKISEIDPVSRKTRAMDAMDGDFSPEHSVHVQFDELVMADGRRLAVHTVASPAPSGVLRFVPANSKGKKNQIEDAASKKISETRQQIRQRWCDLEKQIHEPGKMHKLERRAIAQLPVHPQYIEAGTGFNADLMDPLDFGMESVKAEALTDVGTAPPTGSVVHARLVTPLSSATSKKGEPVVALITEPLMASERLILPEGSVIRGSVIEVRPARRLARNGQLRILFHEVAPPNGLEQKVETSLEGVAVANGEHLKLDREGGAQVTAPKTRYLTTGIQVALAATSAMPDNDARAGGGHGGGDLGGGAANGASGFRLVGVIVGLAARSRIVASGFGAYGAATSIYYHFLARGHDVVYPKDMAMVIGLGTRDQKKGASTPPELGINSVAR